MVEKSRHTATQRSAVSKVREAERFAMNLPVLGRIGIPRPDQLAYYGGLALLAAIEIIDWPIALIVGVGHVLATNEHNRMVQEFGEALEDA